MCEHSRLVQVRLPTGIVLDQRLLSRFVVHIKSQIDFSFTITLSYKEANTRIWQVIGYLNMYNKFKTQCDLSYAKMYTVLASAENSYLRNVLQNIK